MTGDGPVQLQRHATETADALLRRCALGDESAFQALYESEAPRLKAAALRITRSVAVAEDVLHDVFVRVWHDAAGFDAARGSARAWLTMKVRFRAMEIMRRAGREISGLALEDAEDTSPDALAQLLHSADGRALHACLSKLGEDRAVLIRRAFVDGMSHAALAAATGLPLGTLKSMIRRTLVLLRRCLEQ